MQQHQVDEQQRTPRAARFRSSVALACALALSGSAFSPAALAFANDELSLTPATPASAVVIQDEENQLDTLKTTRDQALADVDAAIKSETEAQAAKESTQQQIDELDARLAAAQNTVDEKKSAWDQAEADAKTAADKESEAAEALEAHNDAVAQAQTDLENTQATKAERTTAREEAQARVNAATTALQTAQATKQAAQAAINSEVRDPNSNKGHEEWTALGLYRHILENTSESDAAHWDAQAAIDVLTGGVNSTGHTYKQYEGPEPDGPQASAQANISSNVNKASRSDAISLNNMAMALNFIDEYNQYRERENNEEGYSLNTSIGMNCRLMAVAQVQLDYSMDYNASGGHSQAYRVGENLSWGYSDPFRGWYDEEKADWRNGVTSGVGHYMNIVDQLPEGEENPTAATGFAVHTAAPTYRVAHGQVFHTTSGYSQYNPTITYSTDEFRAQWFEPYYEAQIEAGMFGTPEHVRAAHAEALHEAIDGLNNAQAELDAANEALEQAQAAEADAQANVETAQAQLDELQGKTAGLQSALDDAQAAANQARTAADDAKTEHEQAVAAFEAIDPDNNRARLQAALEAAEAELTAAKQAKAEAQARADAALEALDEFTDLSSSPAITVEDISSVPYTGEAHEPAITVAAKLATSADTMLEQGKDYTVTYANNIDAGEATVTIEGTGSQGSGSWWGKRTVHFTIEQASLESAQIANIAKQTYSGKAIKPTPAVTLDGKTLKLGTDYTLSYSKNVNAGTASVTAAGVGNYTGKTSKTFTIAQAPINKASVSGIVNKVYNGKLLTQSKLVVKALGKTLKLGTDYTVSYSANRNVGTAKITIAGKGNFGGAAKVVTFKITPAANTMTAKTAAKTVSLAKVKTKAQVVSPITVSKAVGKVTYTKASGASALTVNKTNGKVTVKKGTKKGTYNMKVKIRAAGDKNRKPLEKTLTVKVVVK